MAQSQLHAINFKGKLIVIKKESTDEPRHEFIKRAWWISRNLDVYASIKEAEDMSYIWLAHKFYGVSFDESVLSKIKGR